MTWANFYLICFALGFTFSVLSFLLGSHWHSPHGLGSGHVHPGPHVHGGHSIGRGSVGGARAQGLWLSPVTLAVFLAWFGGVGYLLTRFSAMWFMFGLGVALISGIAGSGIIYLFLTHVLMSAEENLDPSDFDMTGVIGRISVPVREGGTGELIYSQAGTRRVCGVRAENGIALPKDSEVVVTRHEKGIAYVRLWAEMTGEDQESASERKL